MVMMSGTSTVVAQYYPLHNDLYHIHHYRHHHRHRRLRRHHHRYRPRRRRHNHRHYHHRRHHCRRRCCSAAAVVKRTFSPETSLSSTALLSSSDAPNMTPQYSGLTNNLQKKGGWGTVQSHEPKAVT